MAPVNRPVFGLAVATRALPAAALAAALAVTGCQAKAQLEECQTRLAAVDAEKVRLEQDLQDIRTDYKELVRGWGVAQGQEEGTTTEQYLADVQQRIDVMKNVVANQVPALVQEQLKKELGTLADTLETQFGEIDTRHAQLRMQLEQVQGALVTANTRLEGIERTGGSIETELAAQRVDEDKLEQELEALSVSIQAFDEKHFLCNTCPEFLEVKRKRQDVILAFHNEMRSALRRVPISVMRAGAGVEEGAEGGEGTEGTEAETPAEGEAPAEGSEAGS
jgi:chromosome segregation ATPase